MKARPRGFMWLPLWALLAVGLVWGQQTPGQQYPGQQNPGQQGEQPPGQPQTAPPTMPTAPQQQSATSDAQIQQNVQNALDSNPDLKNAGVSATVNNGKVMLMGVVSDQGLKQTAETLTTSVAGVMGVQDMITVNSNAAPSGQPSQQAPPEQQQPPSAQPGQQATPPAQPGEQPGEQPPNAQPGEQPGEQPPSAQPGQQATPPEQPGQQPGQQPGEQQPGAQPPSAQPPEQPGEQPPPAMSQSGQPAAQPGSSMSLQDQVQQALTSDPSLSQYALTATVGENGHVELNGTVPSKAEKKQAKKLVQGLNGVQHVDNKIVVNSSVTPTQGQPPASADQPNGQEPTITPGEQPPLANNFAGQQEGQQPSGQQGQQPSRQQGQQPSPQAQSATNPAGQAGAPQDMQTQLQDKLKGNPALSGVMASVSGHTVTLSGTVASKADKKAAEQAVKQSMPKARVHNKIKVEKGGGSGQQMPPTR